MRILMKKFGSEPYVWKEATYKSGEYYMLHDGDEIPVREIEIAAVDSNGLTGYVYCNNCGALIENTPQAIQAHYESMEDKRNCLTCDKLAFNSNRKVTERQMTHQGNGNYIITEKFTSDLWCSNSWRNRRIDSLDINEICKYSLCRRKGVSKPNDTFNRYPGIFDTAITVDHLQASKVKFDHFNGTYYLYDMKSRGTIKACVNNAGIVECFQISSNGNRQYFAYSDKYDKMFYMGNGRYEENIPYWFRSEKVREAHAKIKELYKGAKTA